jgi:hypothetical protein
MLCKESGGWGGKKEEEEGRKREGRKEGETGDCVDGGWRVVRA